VILTRNSRLVSGILGKRTRFQQKDISQLVLQVAPANDVGTAEMVQSGCRESTSAKMAEQLLPKVIIYEIL